MYLSYYLSILYADNASTDLLFSSQDIDLPLPGSELWRPRWLRSAPQISGALWRRTPIRRSWPRRIPTNGCMLRILDGRNFHTFSCIFNLRFHMGSALRIHSSGISSMSSMISSQAQRTRAVRAVFGLWIQPDNNHIQPRLSIMSSCLESWTCHVLEGVKPGSAPSGNKKDCRQTSALVGCLKSEKWLKGYTEAGSLDNAWKVGTAIL